MKRKRTKVQLPPPPPLPPPSPIHGIPLPAPAPWPPASARHCCYGSPALLVLPALTHGATGQRGRTNRPTAAACIPIMRQCDLVRGPSRCGRTQVQFRCYGFLPLSLLSSSRARTTGPAAIHRALDLPFFLPAPRCRSSERWTRRRRRRREKPARPRPPAPRSLAFKSPPRLSGFASSAASFACIGSCGGQTHLSAYVKWKPRPLLH